MQRRRNCGPSAVIGCAVLMLLCAAGCKRSGQRPQIVCGGLVNYACPAGMFCQMKEQCGGIDGEGYCAVRPDRCTNELKQVCGCDGRTYSNPCYASVAGASVAKEGRCDSAVEERAEESSSAVP